MRLAVRFGLADGFVDSGSRDCIGFFSGSSLPQEIENPDGGAVWLKEPVAVCMLIRKTASRPVVPIDPIPFQYVHAARHAFRVLNKHFPNVVSGKLSEGFPDHQPIGRMALIHPGSGSEKKNYDPGLYRQIAGLLGKSGWSKVALIMGPAEIERGFPDFFTEEELIFPIDANALADYLQNASLYIGNDSGVSHLAGYLGVPSVVMYKSTDPNIWGVIGRDVRHLTADNEKDALGKLNEILVKRS